MGDETMEEHTSAQPSTYEQTVIDIMRRLMRDMAREAREEYRAGRTTEIEITEDGRLSPA
jgi:hypothetical protein